MQPQWHTRAACCGLRRQDATLYGGKINAFNTVPVLASPRLRRQALAFQAWGPHAERRSPNSAALLWLPTGLPPKLGFSASAPVAASWPSTVLSVPHALCHRLISEAFAAGPPFKPCASSAVALLVAYDEIRCIWRESSIAVARTSNASRLSACSPDSMSISSTLGSLTFSNNVRLDPRQPPPPSLVGRSVPPPRRELKSQLPLGLPSSPARSRP
mmetsp:Transcript_36208/g.95415  ORF Transcript_36208/g.95415 Transcript_36208/m.95415 type:complete len:215 (+) Transcript_36208:351-995(+)